MHYHVEVVIPKTGDIRKEVEKALAPFDENRGAPGDPTGTFTWDWYQIGGRWKGAHVPDYDRHEDPEHKKICHLCNGTGTRPDSRGLFADEEDWKKWVKDMNGCNGCKGTGQAHVWPTEWTPHPRDVAWIWEIKEDLSCYHLVVNGKVHSVERWTGKTFKKTGWDGNVKKKLEELGIRSGRIVTVDIHS